MADKTILELDTITEPGGSDYLIVARAGVNKKMLVSNVIGTGVSSFNGRSSVVTLQSSDLNGLSGAGLTGIGTGTGGVINTGSTTIGGDSDSDSVGVVALQTRGTTRLQVNNDGTIQISKKVGFNVAAPTAWNHVAPTSGDKLQTIVTSQPTYAIWHSTYSDNNVNGGDPHDHVVNWGWNNNNGAAAIAGLGAFFEQFESEFKIGGNPYFEWHLNGVTYADATKRPIYILFRKDTGDITTSLTFTQMSWLDIAGADIVDIGAGSKTIQLNLGTVIKAATNDSVFLQQLNAASNAYYNIGYYDASDHLIIGETNKQAIHRGKLYLGDYADSPQGGYLEVKPEASNIVPLVIRGYGDPITADLIKVKNGFNADVFTVDYTGKVTVGTLYLLDGSSKQVVLGAADSGGTGFKMLRVAN